MTVNVLINPLRINQILDQKKDTSPMHIYLSVFAGDAIKIHLPEDWSDLSIMFTQCGDFSFYFFSSQYHLTCHSV